MIRSRFWVAMELTGVGIRRAAFPAWVLALALASGACGSASEGESGSSRAKTGGNPSDKAPEPQAGDLNPVLLVPEMARAVAPDEFRARFETTRGVFVIEATRNWSPHGVDRLYNLVKIGFFEDAAFFRVVKDFIAQFGLHGNPEVNRRWAEFTFPDDPPGPESNLRGTISFAQSGPRTRTTQLFVNLKDNADLDSAGFLPVARVIEGMATLDSVYAGYGELYPKGKGPRYKLLNLRGNSYLKLQFPKMDYIRRTVLLQ